MTVRVVVLGPVTVEHDERRLGQDALARRTRLLLVALATADGSLSAEQLAVRLWDEPPATWGAALRNAVAALRGALDGIGLGDQRLVRTTASGWALAGDAVVDLRLAAQEVVRAEAALATDAALTLREAESAVAALGRGVLAADDAAWIEDLRDHAGGLRRRALGALADAALATGRWTAAIEAARTLLDEDAIDEPTHRRLIRALAASGDRAGAIRAFERCRTVLADELGVDPDVETTALYLDALQSGGGGARGVVPPRPGNRFVGRSAELHAVVAGLTSGVPVTIVGRGGMGKSRLALEAAHDRALDVPGGRFWVSLGDLPDSALVPGAVAATVGADGATDPLAATISALAPAGSALLVLDGGERHADALADIVGALLAAVPRLRILSTSRTPLGIDREQRIELGPLDIAGGAAELLRSRLREQSSGRPADDAALGALSSRLGGAPLAIELAAAQLATLSPADLLDGIDSAASAAGGVLDALVEQSFGALDPVEARLVRALGVVEGALPLALARRMAEPDVAGPRVARVLGVLAEIGFVFVDRSGLRWRYGLDPHLREFVRRHTSPVGTEADLAALLAGLGDVAPADARVPPGPYRDAVLAATDAFRTVFVAAEAGRANRELALDLAFRLHRHWASTSVTEGRYWLERLLDGAKASESADLATFAAGYLAYWAGDAPAASALLPAAAEALGPDHPDFAARALLYAGGMSDELDEPERAVDELQRALGFAQRVGGALVGNVELGLASVLAERGDRAAVAAAEAALERAVDAPWPQRSAMLANAALSAWRVGDHAAAGRLAHEAEPLLTADPGIARAQLLVVLAGLDLVSGDLQQALEFATEAMTDLRQLGALRELPPAAAIATRAALRLGDASAAERAARDVIDAALELAVPSAAAFAIESAVAARPGSADEGVLAASARRIRRQGQRPAPAGLEPAPASPASPLEWQDALARAAELLT